MDVTLYYGGLNTDSLLDVPMEIKGGYKGNKYLVGSHCIISDAFGHLKLNKLNVCVTSL